MSYLLDFVKSFSDEELKQFRQLDLIGKEELLRDEYVNRPPANKADETKMAMRLKLTQSHFDKINSILLDKIIEQLYGRDYKKALNSILLKGLSDLLLHEIKILQRRIVNEKIKTHEADFYRAAFDTLIKMFHPNYNSKLTHEYGKKYLASLGKTKTIQHEAYIALFAHYGDMIVQYVSGNGSAYAKPAYVLLQKWEARLPQINNANVSAYYYFVLGNYYKYYGDLVAPFLKANQNALAAVNKATNETRQLLLGRVLCEIGLAHMENNEFAQALGYYEKAFGLSNEQFAKPYFHAGNYFYSSLCNQQPQKAKQIFEKYLQNYLQDSRNRSLRFDILQMKFVLSLHLGNYDTAFNSLEEMRGYKKNEVTHFGNVVIRFSETLYHYRLKEYTVAAALVKRNLKFLNLPENSSAQYNYHRQFIDCIGKLIKQKEGTLRLPEKLDKQVAALQKGIYHMYNSLL